MGGNSSKRIITRAADPEDFEYLDYRHQPPQTSNSVFGSDLNRNSTRSATISSPLTTLTATPSIASPTSNSMQSNPYRVLINNDQDVNSSNAWSPLPRSYYTYSTLDQLEEDDVALAIELSLREHNSNRTLQPTSSSVSTLRSSMPSQQININQSTGASVVRPKVSAPLPPANGQTTIECSICMEFNGNYEMVVVTRCGHVFHRECISPWIQQAGTCPKCRIPISTASLLKIYIDLNTTSTSNSNSKTTNSRRSKLTSNSKFNAANSRNSAPTLNSNAASSRTSAPNSNSNAANLRNSVSNYNSNAARPRNSAPNSNSNAANSRSSAPTSTVNAASSRNSAPNSNSNAANLRNSVPNSKSNTANSCNSTPYSNSNAANWRNSAPNSNSNAANSRNSVPTPNSNTANSRSSAPTLNSNVANSRNSAQNSNSNAANSRNSVPTSNSNATIPSSSMATPNSNTTNSGDSTRKKRSRRNRKSKLPNNQNVVQFSRSVWLSTQNKSMTEQTLADFILQTFGLTSQKMSIQSVKTRSKNVSFKICVDTENTFNILVNASNWPSTFRVREFI